jgi:segregation and condensation protein A
MTTPATVAVELDLAANGPVAPEAAQRVLDYLIFHRSILDETDPAPALLERYMTLVRDLKDGVHVVIPDPLEKATALLFELVMDESFDPWEIDLVKFTETYLERVRREGGVDFAVAGRLLYMAWSILYLQSKEILTTHTEPAAVDPSLGASDDGYLGEMDSPESLDVTTAVLGANPETPLLEPMIRHPETRPVSLLELVQAFGQAEADARQSLRVQELRERLREEQRAPPEVLVHGDIPARDLDDAWEVAKRHPLGEPFEFLSLWRKSHGRDRLVAVFLATLFLARENVLELRQESMAASPLFLVRTSEARAPVAEE